MRRPTGPAQRERPAPTTRVGAPGGHGGPEGQDAQPAAPARPSDPRPPRESRGQGRTPAADERAIDGAGARRVENRVEKKVERKTRAKAERTDASADASPSSGISSSAGAVPSPSSVPSTAASWQAVRRAAAARRKVERSEARRFTARIRYRRRLQLAVVAVVVLVIGGAVAMAYSPLMALKRIDVVGASAVKASDIRAALKGELGTPLPLVKSADIRHSLDDFRLIESYSTQLEPPSTLVVRITERSPLAAVKSGSGFELVDQAGVVISAGAAQPAGYPLIALPDGDQPQKSATFAAAAAVVAALPDEVRKTVTSVSADSANDVTLALQGGKSVVWGGPDQAQLKAADLQALLKGASSAHVYDVSSPESPVTR